jgi:hypothetical protein
MCAVSGVRHHEWVAKWFLDELFFPRIVRQSERAPLLLFRIAGVRTSSGTSRVLWEKIT